MDYCHPCRRHLNGALACPGCGTSVEELRAYADDADARAEGGAVSVEESPYEGDADGPRSRRRAARGGRSADGTRGGRSADGTRLSRRDRKAAAHRRRRRRVLFVSAGLILAAGGLSFAELGTELPGSNPATTASD